MGYHYFRTWFFYLLVAFCCSFQCAYGQGMNSNFLLGYDVALADTNVTSTKAVFHFDSAGYTLNPANFKMPFMAAQANISDENGNLQMVSNGCWIADATGDTMQNGAGLLPNSFTNTWCDDITGIPFPNAAVFLPMPGDTNKVILLHQSGTNTTFKSDGLYSTIIDKTLNGGLGGVIPGLKNVNNFQMGLNPGIVACKHANGRDWWVLVFKDSSDIVYTTLLSPAGFSTPTAQPLNVVAPIYLLSQAAFSPDGSKFAYTYYNGGLGNFTYFIRIFDFNRCTGILSNKTEIVFQVPDGGLGLAFSSDSKKFYSCTFNKVFQINLDTSNISASLDTVATYDGYAFPYSFLKTDFWLMTLANNGKINISSGNSVIDFHIINYPDSEGVSCDLQQHAIRLPCYSWRSHVYHPNYYLGCDTTLGCPCLVSTGLTENGGHDFKAKLSPNPGRVGFDILYLLPQNKSGVLSIFDLQGRLMHSEALPPWSTRQSISAGNWSPGVYQVIIESGEERGVWKWVKL